MICCISIEGESSAIAFLSKIREVMGRFPITSFAPPCMLSVRMPFCIMKEVLTFLKKDL